MTETYVPNYEQLPGRWYVLFYAPGGRCSVTTGRELGFSTWLAAVAHAARANTIEQQRARHDLTTLRYFVINEVDAKEFSMVIVNGRMLWPEQSASQQA